MSGRMTLFSRWLGTMSIDVYWPFGISDSLRPRLSRREDVAPHIARSLLPSRNVSAIQLTRPSDALTNPSSFRPSSAGAHSGKIR